MALLAEAGQVVNVHLPTDRETGRPRGFAFVEFAQPSEATDAITRFHNREVGGRRLNVNAADDRPRRAGERPAFRPSRRGPSYGAPAPPRCSASSATTSVRWRRPAGRRAAAPAARAPFKNKGSRRGLRARKRSLNF